MANYLQIYEPDFRDSQTLWSNADKTRQFLIPDTLELPSGEFLLRTATGREQHVDPGVLSSFEVSAEEAQAWAKAQLGEVTRWLKASLKEALFGASKRVQAQGRECKGPETTQQTSPTPGLDLLADITDTPRERLSDDYRAIGQALRNYLKDITVTAGEALSGDPAREREARRRMRDWAETLSAHGIPTAQVDDPDAAPGSPKRMPDHHVPGSTAHP
jgi:hypothetical protein